MLNGLWQNNKNQVICVLFFSIVYATIGCLWLFVPQEKYYLGGAGTRIEVITPMLGWSIPFLNQPLYILVPGLVIAGWIAGWVTWRLLRLRWPNKILGISLWTVLVFINYQVGQFLYIFRVMRWLD